MPGDPRFDAIERALEPVIGPGDPLPPVAWSGPTTWWAGPLDVEGLAIGSVRLALRAAARLAGARGRPARFGTTAARIAGDFGAIGRLRVDGRPATQWAPMSGYVQAADGWVRVHANYPHHAAALTRVLGVRGRDELERLARRIPARELEARIRAGGGIAGALRTAEEWRSTPEAAAVDAQEWIAFRGLGARRGDGARRDDGDRPPSDDSPLTGVRVLDLTRVLAGPVATRLLALLGADVLRIDPPDRPELLDQYLATGAGKRSAVADLRARDRLDRVHELLDAADLVVTGYRPAALAAFGLDDDGIRDRHRDVVHVNLSAWGDRGPWGDQRGFDSIVQAVIGIGHRYGGIDAAGRFVPGALPVQALDLATGYGMAAAALALLAARPDRGAGSAFLSLARTGHLLLDAGPRASARASRPAVRTVTTPSAHGELTQAVAVATVDGVDLPLRSPGRYGAATLGWAQGRRHTPLGPSDG